MALSTRRVLFGVLLLYPGLALAGTTGKIAGRITDASTGEPLPMANVFIKSLGLGGSSDREGYYFVLKVPPGEHEVTVSVIGYAPAVVRKVTVQVDRTTPLDVLLQPEALLAEEIVVEARRPPVSRDQTSTIQGIDVRDIEGLPVNSVQAVLRLQTGIVTSASGGLHLRGGRTGEVAYYLDGYRVEDALFNGDVLEVNNQAIQQMELLSGTFNAEYGNALSGVVNIVTKERFDQLSANLTYKRTNMGFDESSDNLNERYYEGYLTTPLWEGSPLGVLLSGKKVDADNYYFSGISQVRTDTSGQISRESIEFSQDKPFGSNDYLSLLGKLYIRPFAGGRVTLLYNFSNREWTSYDHTLRFVPDSSYLRNSESNLLGVAFSHAVSEDLFYELRVSSYRYTFLRRLAGLHYSQYPVPLFLRFDNSRFYRTSANSAYEDQLTRTIDGRGDLTWQVDRHNLLKAGAEIKLHNMDYFYVNNPANPVARYQFAYNQKPTEGSFYIQDKVEFLSLILNAGIRYDYYDPRATFVANPFDPSSLTSSEMRSSWSPRVGIAYPVRDNMVFHFSYGQFFQRPEYQAMYENLDRVFPQDEPLFGNPLLEPEKTAAYEFGVHTTIGSAATIQTTVFTKKIEDLIGILWTYQPLPYATYINEDFAWVRGFEIAFKWNSRNIFAAANYTLSVAEGSSSSQQERYSGAFDIVGTQSLRFLPLDFDQLHTINAQVNFTFGKQDGPFGLLPEVFQNFTFNVLMRYGSGLPYTANPARARYVADRNNSRLPPTFVVDLLARKDFYFGDFYVAVFADVRNLFNRKNVRSVYSATGSPDVSGSLLRNITPDFDQDPENYYPPRTVYLGINLGI